VDVRLHIHEASLPPLHLAALTGNVDALRRLLGTGADPNEPGCVRDECDGWRSVPGPSYIATPLMLAAANPASTAVPTLKLLLDAGAEVGATSTRGDAALWFAAAVRNVGSLRLLLEYGAPPNLPCSNGSTAICESAAAPNLNALRVLLRYGASPNAIARGQNDQADCFYAFQIPLFAAAEGGHAECIQLLVNAGARIDQLDIRDSTSLMYASTASSVGALVAAGCDVNARDAFSRNAIDHAAERGHRAVLLALVGAGADIEACDDLGQTSLLRYCSSGILEADIIRALLGCGANIRARWFKGRTALHEAAQLYNRDRYGHLHDAIRVLVDSGLDVDVTDDRGDTPLHSALGEGGLDLDAVRALIELGADPNRRDHLGKRAFDLAHRWPGGEDRVLLRILSGGPQMRRPQPAKRSQKSSARRGSVNFPHP
jgi:ankyrin repeat protein